jgi:hypothetical protein
VTALPNFLPEDTLFRRWVKAVEAFAARTPLRIERRYDGDEVPIDIATGVKSRPTSVQCIAATQRDDPSETESGARVTWSWVGGSNGVVRIHAIDLTSATTEYDVTIEVR